VGELHGNILATYLNEEEDINSLKWSRNGTFIVISLYEHLTCSKSGCTYTLMLIYGRPKYHTESKCSFD
jgi:hypothetical protein